MEISFEDNRLARVLDYFVPLMVLTAFSVRMISSPILEPEVYNIALQ